MRTLIVTHYFPPETGAPQARLSGLAATWAADGDEVTVLTGMPNHPTGVLPPQYRRAIRRRERRDGYRVVRTWLYATPNEGIARKTLGHLSFMASSVLLGWRACGPADVVVVSSPTFFSILSGWLLARLKRARFVVEVRDLWPAIFVELGVLTNRRVIRLLERLELAAYAAADQVVVVSEGFRDDLISRGVPPGKVHTIRNGVDTGPVHPGLAGRSRRPRQARRGPRRLPGAVRRDARHLARPAGDRRRGAPNSPASPSGSRSSGTGRTSAGWSGGSRSSGCATWCCCPACRTPRCPGCSRRRTSAWSRCARCRCSRRSSRRRCSSTWPRARR